MRRRFRFPSLFPFPSLCRFLGECSLDKCVREERVFVRGRRRVFMCSIGMCVEGWGRWRYFHLCVHCSLQNIDNLTVAEMLEANPEWRLAIEEDIKNHNWGPEAPESIVASIKGKAIA